MHRRFIILGLLLSLCPLAESQPLIGLSKEEVKSMIKKEYKDFAPDNSIKKQVFNYLKYVNESQTITFIIYFTDDDFATSTKMVCDYTEYDFIMDDLNEKYEKVGKNEWGYSYNGKNYSVVLKEEDWYFTVRERLKEG